MPTSGFDTVTTPEPVAHMEAQDAFNALNASTEANLIGRANAGLAFDHHAYHAA